MPAYVVYAHPSSRSFSRAVLERFTAAPAILGGMMPGRDPFRDLDLDRAYDPGRTL